MSNLEEQRDEEVNKVSFFSESEARAVVSCLNETIHQSLDGWEHQEQIVIAKFLQDLQLAVKFEQKYG